ncbi:MAG: glycosyltransferase family 39 protein [Prolixibacteraceae bacterium]|nr:glycosyltransferase family 39 protein [Prolixibacteraceae bacterium]
MKYINEIIISFLWFSAIIIINPIGEFPLNDDWAYSLNVYHLSQEGKLILSDWPAMSLIAQVLWGALVTGVFGFSFTVLRFSTLFVGLFTVILFYKILINATSNKTTSLAGALLFMFSPLFFVSSYTFMTEVYFLFAINLSLFYFFKFYKDEKIKLLLAGSFFVLVSSLIRQPGVAVGAAFAVIYLANKRFSIRHLGVALTPLLIGMVGLYSYSVWLHLTGRTTNYSDISILTKQLSEAPVRFYLTRFGIIALYFGLFSIPISIVLIPRILKNYKWYEKGIMLIAGGIAYMSDLLTSFPAGNIVYNLGLGPKLLKDTYWGDNIDPILSSQSMYIIKLLSLLSAVIVVTFFCIETFKGLSKIFQAKSSPARLLRATFIVFFLIYFVFVLINPIFFDRYILPCIPAVFIIVLPVRPLFTRINRIAFGVLLSVYVIFSIAGTHDYMGWNRARWEAINYLTDEKKIDRHKIDGGFEFNAWFQTAACNPEVKGRISWWFVSSDDYVVSFGEIDGFETIKKIGYFRLLPPGNDSICILFQEQKIIPFSAFPLRCDLEKRSVDNNFFLSENIDVDFVGGNLQNNAESLSGEFSIKLDSINQYGLLSKYSNIQTDERFIVKVWRKGSDEAGIVISAVPGNNFYHFNNQVIETNSNGWNLIKTEITIPENCNGYQLGVYLWNPGKNNVWFDDLEINKLKKKELMMLQ